MLNSLFSFLKKFNLLLICILLTYSCKKENYLNVEKYEAITKNATFSGTNACITCHEQEFTEWQYSHHDLSMQLADSLTVLGNFNNASFISKGITYAFLKRMVIFM